MMTLTRLPRLVIPLLVGLCARSVLGDMAQIPETMPVGIPEVLVGSYSFRGLGTESIPTRTGADAVIWGRKNQSEMVPPLTTYTPQVLPSGNTYSTYPYAGGRGWTIATVGNFRTAFGGITPGQVLDNFALYFTLNETGPALPVQVTKLDVTIISHLNPDPVNDWSNPDYIMARWTLEGPLSPAVPPITPDPFLPPYIARLLNETQRGQSAADYEAKFTGGLHLASYAPEEHIRLELNLAELTSGAEAVWARTGGTVVGDFDYGDAPDSYGTLQASGGPYHGIGSHEWLGSAWDGEPEGQPTPKAVGDDQLGIDDEDGMDYGDEAAYATISVNPADLAANGGTRYGDEAYKMLYLDGWLDWGRDGTFLEAGDHLDLSGDPNDGMTSLALDPNAWGGSSTTVTIPLPGFIPSQVGDYFRWRLAYGAPITVSGGYAPYGEVEDYFVTPEPSTVVLLGGALVALARRRRRK